MSSLKPDLKIVIDEICTEYQQHDIQSNRMDAVRLDNFGYLFGSIPLDAVFQDLVIEGVIHPDAIPMWGGQQYTVDTSIAVLGYIEGDLAIKNVHVTTAHMGLAVWYYEGDSHVIVGGSEADKCVVDNVDWGSSIRANYAPIVISHNEIRNSHLDAVSANYNSGLAIENNRITMADPEDYLGSGFKLQNSDGVIVQDNTISGTTWGPAIRLFWVTNSTIEGNLITDYVIGNPDWSGIDVGYSNHNRIAKNQFVNVTGGRAAVELWGWWNGSYGNTLKYNDYTLSDYPGWYEG